MAAPKYVMASIGEKLRQERRQRNLDLAQVANQTKINSEILEAIEADEWSRLPGTFFAKSFVRQYAKAVGVDAADIDAELERLFGAEKPASVSEPEPPPQRIHWPPLSIRSTQPGLRDHRWLTLLVLFVSVGLCCYAIFALWRSARQARAPLANHAATTPAARTEFRTSKQPEREVESGIPPHVPGQRSSPERTPVPRPTGKLLVDLVATEDTWVSLTVDGRRVFRSILSPGDTKSFEGTEGVRLSTGNAGGLEIHWNGKAIGPIGRRGAVCVVEFTRGGFQIRREGI
jgi:cytoskeletal protein RodZ